MPIGPQERITERLDAPLSQEAREMLDRAVGERVVDGVPAVTAIDAELAVTAVDAIRPTQRGRV